MTMDNPIATAIYMVTVARRACAFTIIVACGKQVNASNSNIPTNNTVSQQQQYQPNSPVSHK